MREAQGVLVRAGHVLTFDWTQGMTLVEDFATQPERSAAMASAMVDAVLAADAVVGLATEHEGRGMFVELGAAIACAQQGSVRSVAVVGDVIRESVFYLHPQVRRYACLTEWIVDLAAL